MKILKIKQKSQETLILTINLKVKAKVASSEIYILNMTLNAGDIED